jgi:cyclopropane fatty-acyl-phospholipid synthase-like methyltransferase
MTDQEQQLLNTATQAYRPAGKFAWHFARGKLSGDPAFFHILRKGLIAPQSRVLDIGCGQGVLASLLMACDVQHTKGEWPKGWAAAPAQCRVHGIELMPKDVARANAALHSHKERATFEAHDMCKAEFGKTDVVVILDVLHYVNIAAQDDVLARVRDALSPKGTLLLRVGDAAAGLPFKISNWVDHTVMFARGHGYVRLYCRPLAQWQAALVKLGFEVQTVPLSQGTPFANVMLVARLT